MDTRPDHNIVRPDHIMTIEGKVVHVDYYTDGSIGLWRGDVEFRVRTEDLESILPKLEG